MRTLLIALATATVLYAIAVAALVAIGRKTAAREVAMLLPNLALLFKDLIRDPRVPNGSKALLIFGAAWIASPIDLIPEFIPFLGPLDDAVVAALILRHLRARRDPTSCPSTGEVTPRRSPGCQAGPPADPTARRGPERRRRSERGTAAR